MALPPAAQRALVVVPVDLGPRPHSYRRPPSSAGVTRAGLRYIDEVRAPNGEGPGWAQWLPDIMSPGLPELAAIGASPVAWNGAAQYRIGHDRSLVLRYGQQAAQPGLVVHPDRPLRRSGPRPVGPFFLLDFDASWEPQTVPAWLLNICSKHTLTCGDLSVCSSTASSRSAS
jgi:uncharacterized protein (TIGR04255 family)